MMEKEIKYIRILDKFKIDKKEVFLLNINIDILGNVEYEFSDDLSKEHIFLLKQNQFKNMLFCNRIFQIK